jgi:hypothetical protein
MVIRAQCRGRPPFTVKAKELDRVPGRHLPAAIFGYAGHLRQSNLRYETKQQETKKSLRFSSRLPSFV